MNIKKVYILSILILSICNCLSLLGIFPKEFWRFSTIGIIFFTIAISGYIRNNKIINDKYKKSNIMILTFWIITLIFSLISE